MMGEDNCISIQETKGRLLPILAILQKSAWHKAGLKGLAPVVSDEIPSVVGVGVGIEGRAAVRVLVGAVAAAPPTRRAVVRVVVATPASKPPLPETIQRTFVLFLNADWLRSFTAFSALLSSAKC